HEPLLWKIEPEEPRGAYPPLIADEAAEQAGQGSRDERGLAPEAHPLGEAEETAQSREEKQGTEDDRQHGRPDPSVDERAEEPSDRAADTEPAERRTIDVRTHLGDEERRTDHVGH